jgi:hypothetical protein
MNGNRYPDQSPAPDSGADADGLSGRDRGTPSPKPSDWDGFFAALADADVPDDVLDPVERRQGVHDRDPFAEWEE